MIQLLMVGGLKGDFRYLIPGIEEYLKRLSAYVAISVQEVKDEPVTATVLPEMAMAKEAERLQPFFQKAAYTLVLSERGEKYDSLGFAKAWFERVPAHLLQAGKIHTNGGSTAGATQPMIVVIGGAWGLAPALIDQADWCLSLSSMTMTHQHVRLLFLEQLYRAYKIHRGEPYHK